MARALLLALWLGLGQFSAGLAQAADAVCQLRQGLVRSAADGLAATHAAAPPGPTRARAAAALGQAYLRLNRLDAAQPLLEEAQAGLEPGRERAAALLDLGNLHLARRQEDAADDAWARALQAAPLDAELTLAVELNRIRLAPPVQRLPRLQAAALALPAGPASAIRARHALNIASQAAAEGSRGTGLALRLFERGRDDAVAVADDALAAEAYDGLGALYERQQRVDDALRLTERGLQHAQRRPERELMVPLEWRAGRLALLQGQPAQALAAYRRAVEHVEAVRADLPVQYVDGRSSFRDTLEPVYLGLTDLLLRQSAQASGDERSMLLRQARDTVELIKQTELEDYLRDRCSLGEALGGARTVAAYKPPPGTAIYYPIILPDRLELLVETATGIERTAVDVSGEDLRRMALNFVSALRAGGGYRSQSEQLFRWLVAPVQARLDAQGIRTLVAVPDGVLRLVPMAALHDGRDFIIRRWALATVPGLTLTAASARSSSPLQALLAGMSEPGPVLDKLPPQVISAMLEPGLDPAQPRAASRSAPGPANAAVRDALRDALALPGVKREVEDLAKLLDSPPLLDQGFTLAALQQQLARQDHEVVHIASHGVFGDSADSTFIMTYDELLTLDGLQRLLAGNRPRKKPIELITLSACQTAEGDDRAPLGMSGTALKARARSALGTLWPVSDNAAQTLMASFYRQLAAARNSPQGGKIDALRAAQIGLLDTPAFRHPFFWAPFILVGDWQ